MRIAVSIFLLLIMLLSFGGYQLLLDRIDRLATTRLEGRLDKGEYNEDELLEIRIPFQLPYHQNWQDYESFYGQVNYQGEYYQYVKRKLVNDTLYLLCIPHPVKTRIEEARMALNSQPDQPLQGNERGLQLVKMVQLEFLQSANLQIDPAIVYKAGNNFITPAFYLSSSYALGIFHPPRC